MLYFTGVLNVVKNILNIVTYRWYWSYRIPGDYLRKNNKFNLPQNGIPCGTQVPFVPHIRLAGPNNSNPLSHVYRATVPGSTVGVLNSTVEWAGAPGNPHFSAKIKGKKNLGYN